MTNITDKNNIYVLAYAAFFWVTLSYNEFIDSLYSLWSLLTKLIRYILEVKDRRKQFFSCSSKTYQLSLIELFPDNF